MRKVQIWSNKGVALYPPHFAMVGQNRIFNALHKFKEGFRPGDISGFFVIVGDWGLGKTRLGYELFAETAGHVDEWVLNSREYIVPNAHGHILEPQLAEGILPLFIDYKAAIDDELAADTWVPKVTCNALSLLWNRPKDLRVSPELLDDMVAVLKAKGVDLAQVRDAMDGAEDWRERLDAAMEILRARGIEYLWIVVDEVETPSDLKSHPDYLFGSEIEEEDLAMISQVIKEARYRENHPYVNFLLLCSLGMSDTINIGPNRRRSDLVTLDPNHISDLLLFGKHLEESGHTVDYPAGTLEAAFIATNRNFGWFNRVMSSIHTSWEGHKRSGKERPPAWKLIEEYARAEARSNEIFDLRLLKTLKEIPEEIQGGLIFGQLPMEIGPDLDSSMAARLLSAEVPGIGPAFASLIQIHMDESTLANELVRPDYGFKKADRPGDDYFNPYTEFSVSGVLSALRAFSVSVGEYGDFVIYEDLDQFVEQLATLYPHERMDEKKGIERAAEPLHGIFKPFAVESRRLVGVSFKLLKKINVKMSLESRTISFFRDTRMTETLGKYVAEQISSPKRRMEAICRGMARALDDTPRELRFIPGLDPIRHVAFGSDFHSPPFEALSVTDSGRVTVAYCDNVPLAIQELSGMLGKAGERLHPILVLFGPDGDIDGFEREIRRKPLLQRAAILRKLTTFEEGFLIQYSGRNERFDPFSTPLSQHTHATLGSLREELRSRFQAWRKGLEETGLILRPIWYKPGPGKEDFYSGYRYLVANNETVDGLDPAICQIPDWNDLSLSNFKSAAKRNTDPSKGYPAGCLSILETEPFQPLIAAPLVRVFREMRSQVGEETLAKRFFFAAREKEVKGKPIAQIIDFLKGLGVVISPSSGQFKAINKLILDELRTRTSNWLNTTAGDLIEEIRDIFPDQAKALEKGFKAEALILLAEAEKIASNMDFSLLSSDDSEITEDDIANFRKVITDYYRFEQTLLKICPMDPNQSFAFSEHQIKFFQEKYSTLPFWEKVHFLRWLRREHVKKRDEILRSIDEQLADAMEYTTVCGKPFPIAPLTLPLKSIKNEISSPISGSSQTTMDHLPIPDLPQKINQYFLMGKYEEAWRRLSKLAELSSKTSQDGIWQRFMRQYEQWKTAVEQFSQAQIAWNDLNAFMSDAEASVWSGTTGLRKEYETLEDQIEEGLKNDIDSQIATQKGLSLLERLSAEIAAIAHKFPGLSNKISNFHEDVKNRLRKIINDPRLQALNHLLRAEGDKEWHAPSCQRTYQTTRQAFEAFNNGVSDEGRACLEGKDRKTNWELWVEIYTELSTGSYAKRAEHEPYLDELEAIGLIERTVKLR